eukprot:426742_1
MFFHQNIQMLLVLTYLLHTTYAITNISTPISIIPTDLISRDWFASYVAISRRYMVALSYNYQNTTSSTAYLFQKTNSIWLQIQKYALPSKITTDLNNGYTQVALEGDVLMIGLQRVTPTDPLGVYVWERDPITSVWQQTTILRNASTNLGYAISISGHYAIMSHQNNLCMIYKRIAYGVWNQTHVMYPSDSTYVAGFGRAVAISTATDGTFAYAVIGAYLAQAPGKGSINTGYAFVYEKDINTEQWFEIAPLDVSGITLNVNAFFGSSVALSHNYLIIGARMAPGSYISPYGYVYIYERQNNGIWQYIGTPLQSSDGNVGDAFGWRVAIVNTQLVVTAPSARGSCGNGCGAAYVFERISDIEGWLQTAKIEGSSMCPVTTRFGATLGFSENNIVLGCQARACDSDGSVFCGGAYIWSTYNTPRPTTEPSVEPTYNPTNNPTFIPTFIPTKYPTNEPTNEPTLVPTFIPTNKPTNDPTKHPTKNPTFIPTFIPTIYPTIHPTTNAPTNNPTKNPTNI